MLSAEELINSREQSPPNLPSFGIKEFEPDGLNEQNYQIQDSLSEIKKIISYKNVKTLGSMSQAIWCPKLELAEITHQVGSIWATMGHVIEKKLYIYPEEALYLLETGAIEIFFNGVLLSIQRAYFLFLKNESNLTLEKYRVYAHLNSYGFKVLRHSFQNTTTEYQKHPEVKKPDLKLKHYKSDLNKRPLEFVKVNTCSHKKQKKDTKINFPVSYNKNSDIKEVLTNMQLFDFYEDYSEGFLNFDFDLYTEACGKTAFKKSCLPIPHYRVIIHRSEDPIPDFKDLCRLSKKYNDKIPVIHAIVFPDYITFYEINPVILPNTFD